MSLLGIPSDEQLTALIAGAIDRAKAAGVTLEDHGADLLGKEVTAALAGVFAGLTLAEDPLLVELRKANESLAALVDTVKQYRNGVSIVPRTQGVV